MNRAVIGIGSNIDPRRNIGRAIERIGREHAVVAQSRFVETEPIGVKDQPNFVNGAILIETDLDREGLRVWLHRVEGALGRARTGRKFGPRTIDLDIVVWNGRIVHKDVSQRDFLRRAVLEVAPEVTA